MHDARGLSLRPKDNTSAAIRDSLDRAVVLRAEAVQTIATAEAARGRLLISASSAEVRANEDTIARSTVMVQQIDALSAALVEPLEAALKAERIDELQAACRGLGIDAAVGAFVQAWQRDYARHAQAIAAIMDLHRLAHDKITQAFHINARLRAEGVDVAPLPDVDALAVGGRQLRNLGSIVRLPGVGGAPFVPLETHERAVPQPSQEVKDWDGPMGWGGNDYERSFPRPLKTKPIKVPDLIVKTQIVVREDVPFWPVNQSDWR